MSCNAHLADTSHLVSYDEVQGNIVKQMAIRRNLCVHQSSKTSLRQESGYVDVFLRKRLREATHHVCARLDPQDTIVQKLEDLRQEVSEQPKAGKQCASHQCRRWIATPTRRTNPTST